MAYSVEMDLAMLRPTNRKAVWKVDGSEGVEEAGPNMQNAIILPELTILIRDDELTIKRNNHRASPYPSLLLDAVTPKVVGVVLGLDPMTAALEAIDEWRGGDPKMHKS